MISKSVELGKQIGGLVWRFAKSENVLAMIKVAATFAAFVHSVEELRKANRTVGFQTKNQIGFKR